MKFDTEEAFFAAVYRKANFGPAQVGDLVDEALGPRNSTSKAVTTQIVKLMREAFDVHQRASSQIGPGDDLLGHRMDQAREMLPDGWQIVVQAWRGSLTVDLYGPDDERREFAGANDSLSGLVNAALDKALNTQEGNR